MRETGKELCSVVDNKGVGRGRDEGQFSLEPLVYLDMRECLAVVGLRKLGLENFCH